ncbi:MAG TPA: heme ABC exporter ATP-binding protein CcmA [Thermoanaerobaculia bacterium]|nr:heme ABC exporter ATP-binding protein CcmA [Thermoanaerobaculia bacterium]
MQNPPSTKLSFENIRRRFGRLSVLQGVSGEVGSGEMLLVTGPNGSGKSTLLRCLAGLLAPDRGTIKYWEDDRVFDTDERRRRVGYVAPDLALYSELTVAENLEFFAKLRRTGPEWGLEVLRRLALPTDRMAGALSSGMRQRLRWGWAMLHQPRLLLLDEPFQNLDSPGEEGTKALLYEHLDQGGLAVVANPMNLEIDRVTRHIDLGR